MGHLVPKVLEKALVCHRLDVLGPGLSFTLEGVPFQGVLQRFTIGLYRLRVTGRVLPGYN